MCGEAWLHDGKRAAGESQKFIDHRGSSGELSLGRLGLAPDYAFAGDRAKAPAAYRDFLALW
jgi:hypothetical protein